MSFEAPATSDDVPGRARPLRTLSFRINAWYVIALIVSLGVLAAFAVPIVRAALEREQHVVLERRLERHVALLTNGLPAYRDTVDRSRAIEEPTDAIRVRDGAGRVLYERGDIAGATYVAARFVGDLRLEVGAPAMRWEAVADELWPGVLVLVAAALALAVIGGHAVTRRGLRPIRELAATTREVIRSGDLSARVVERGTRDELDTLSGLFNRMLERNQKLVVAMREALDNVGHDLRTPLTRVRGVAEVALRSKDPAAAREALADCIEESDKLLVMLRTIMDISEAETGIMRLDRVPVDVVTLCDEVADLYSVVAEEAGVELAVERSPAVTVQADPSRLRQAVANLVDNAIKYTAPGGRVVVRPVARGAAGGISVSDSGHGIAADAIPRIWDRLYRADRSRSKKGLGLGLSLVKAIVEAHGGSVAVDSRPGEGSTFTLLFPPHSPDARDS